MTDEPSPIEARRSLAPVTVIVLIALGAASGSTLRFGVGLAVPGLLGTLVVNVAGSLLIGIFLGVIEGFDRFSRAVRLVAGTGFLSSLTTYSAFAVDVFTTAPEWAIAYTVATYGLGFLGVLVGGGIARLLRGGGP